MAHHGSLAHGKSYLLLSLPLCMLSSGLAAQTVLNATDLASLRTHIASANAGGGDFVINLAAGTYTLNGGAGDASPATGDLDITKATGNLTFAGAATATTIIDANNVDRAFHINAGANVTVTFQNLTIQKGRAVDNGSAGTEARGGGIYVQSNSGLTLTNVALKTCEAAGAVGAVGAMGAAGGAGAAARGGAIYVSGGTVSISGSTFTLNKATGGNGGTGGAGQNNQSTGTVSSYLIISGGNGGDGGAGANAQGGAIYAAGGTVTLTNSTLSTSSATGGNGASGGVGGNAVQNSSSFASCNAGAGGWGGAGGSAQGAAIYFATGTLNLNNSTLNANAANGGNGGLGALGGDGIYNGSSLGQGNGGGGGLGGDGGLARGGGIYFAAGTLTAVNSTLSANTGKGGNGGNGGNGGDGQNSGPFPVFRSGGPGGDGGDSGAPQGANIYVGGGAATLNNATTVLGALTVGTAGNGGAAGSGSLQTGISPGSAGTVQAPQGGGMFVAGGTLSITSTIVANNTGPTVANGIDIFGNVTANNSLIEATTGATITGTANVNGVDPNLAALANNGGPTQTHALPATGSPALDAGANPGALATDQRGTGFVRSSGTGVDIGAFENQSGGGGAPPPPVVTDPAAAISVNANNYSIQGTAQANVLVRIYSDANNDGIVNGGDAVVASQQLTGGGTNFSIATTLNQNAANNFLATAYNGSLESSPTDVPTITEDSVAPNMVVITDPAGAISVMAANYNIQGTAEANSLVRIYRDLNSNGLLDTGEPVVGSQQLSGGGTNFAISTPLIAASINRFLATATDAAANASMAVNVPTITETSIAPTAPPIITSPAAPITVNLPSYNVVGTAVANALVRIYRDNNNDGIVNGPDAQVGSQQLVSAGVDFSINVTLTQNAANDFLATAEAGGLPESSVTNVPTITDNTGVSGGTGGGGGGGGGGGCSTDAGQGPWQLLTAALAALMLALRWVCSEQQARKR